MATQLNPVTKQMFYFKTLIHGKDKVVCQLFSKKEALKHHSKSIAGRFTADIKKQLVAANIAGMEIAMMVNKGAERKSVAVTFVNALFVDYDGGNVTKEMLLALAIVPHLIIKTSPGKFHAYWLIKDCETAQFPNVMKALAAKLGSDPNVCDLARVMRMPGTYNHKYEPPFLVNIVHRDEEAKPIRLKFFIKKMMLNVEAGVEKPTKPVEQCKQKSDMSAQQIKTALDALSPEVRDIWLKVGMAIHSNDPTDVGYEQWTGWAKSSEKFDEAEHRKIWDGFVANNGVTIKSLFWMAGNAKQGEHSKLTEGSLATLFADIFRGVVRYSPEENQWYFFNGVVWVADAQAPTRYVREMMLGLKAETSESAKDNSNKQFLTVTGFKSIVHHAELLPEFQISPEDFDKNPNFFAVQNGVIDLTTGQFRQANANDYLRRQANVAFDAKADCREFFKFMASITCGDNELSNYIQRVMGYIVFGHAEEQLFFLALGSGGNGKGVLMRAIKAMLGEYAVSVSPNLLTSAYSGNANAPSPALAVLCGARYVICTEMKKSDTKVNKLDEAFIKQFAGGDEITARHGYGSVFTFKPEGKLFLSANYRSMPDISAADDAMWRRLIPIPFNAKYVKGVNDDGKLDGKLANEFSGILNWLIKGALAYSTYGLGSCPAVDEIKLKLRKEADSVLAWMSGYCKKNSKAETQASEAFDSYKNFMRNSERKCLSVQSFRAGLLSKGFMHHRGSTNNYYTGFRILK